MKVLPFRRAPTKQEIIGSRSGFFDAPKNSAVMGDTAVLDEQVRALAYNMRPYERKVGTLQKVESRLMLDYLLRQRRKVEVAGRIGLNSAVIFTEDKNTLVLSVTGPNQEQQMDYELHQGATISAEAVGAEYAREDLGGRPFFIGRLLTVAYDVNEFLSQ